MNATLAQHPLQHDRSRSLFISGVTAHRLAGLGAVLAAVLLPPAAHGGALTALGAVACVGVAVVLHAAAVQLTRASWVHLERHTLVTQRPQMNPLHIDVAGELVDELLLLAIFVVLLSSHTTLGRAVGILSICLALGAALGGLGSISRLRPRRANAFRTVRPLTIATLASIGLVPLWQDAATARQQLDFLTAVLPLVAVGVLVVAAVTAAITVHRRPNVPRRGTYLGAQAAKAVA